MPYTVRGNTGRLFHFADDITLDEAAAYVDEQEKPPTYGEVATKALENMGATTSARGAQLTAGIKRIAGEIVGNQDWVDEAESVQKLAEQDITEMSPKNMSLTQQGVYSGITQLPENLLMLGAGALGAIVRGATVASKASAAIKAYEGAKLALMPMAGAEAVRSYGESRALGQDVLPAATGAAVHGAAEYFGEIFSAKPMADILTGSGGTRWLINNLARFLGREIAGEEGTTLVQSAVTAARDGKTLGEWLDNLPQEVYTTAVATAVGGGAQTAVLGATSKAADALTPSNKVLPPQAPLDLSGSKAVPPAQTATPAPVDETGLPPVAPERTHIVEPMIFDRETGKFVPANSLNINRQDLPFEQRLDLLRLTHQAYTTTQDHIQAMQDVVEANAKSLEKMSPGFDATAEDIIQQKGLVRAERQRVDALQARAEQLREQYAEQKLAFEQELVSNPELFAFVKEKDYIDGVLSGDIRDSLSVTLIQAAAGNDVPNDLISLTQRAFERGDIPKELVEILSGNVQLTAAMKQRLDTYATFNKNTLMMPADMPLERIIRYEDLFANYSDRYEYVAGEILNFAKQRVVADSMSNTSSLIGELGAEGLRKIVPGQVLTTLQPIENISEEQQKESLRIFSKARVTSEINHAVSEWIRMFAPNVSVIVTFNANTPHGRSSVYPIAKDTYVMELPLAPATIAGEQSFAPQNKPEVLWWNLLTAAHEFGHIIHLNVLQNASLEERRAIGAAYLADLQELNSLNFEEGIKKLFGLARYAHAMSRIDAWAAVAGVSAKELMAMPFYEAYTKIGWASWGESHHYILSAEEWFAEQMVKYITSRGGVSKDLQPLFQRIATRIADLYRRVVSQIVSALRGFASTATDNETRVQIAQIIKPNATFAAFVDALALRFGRLHEMVAAPEAKAMSIVGEKLTAVGANALDIPTIVAKREEQTAAAFRQKYSPTQVNTAFSDIGNSFLPRILKIHGRVSANTLLTHMRQQLEIHPYADSIVESTRLMLQEPMFAKPFLVSEFLPRFFNDVLDVKATLIKTQSDGKDFVTQIEYKRPLFSLAQKTRAGNLDVWRTAGKNEAEINGHVVGSADAVIQTILAFQHAAEQGAKYIVLNHTTHSEVASFVKNLGGATVSNKDGIAKVLIPTWAYKNDASPAFGMPLESVLSNIADRFKVPALHSYSHATARFDILMKYVLGAFQIIKKNMHIPGIAEAKQALLNRIGYRAEWHRKANQTLRQWTKLPKDQANKIAKMLLDEVEAYEAAISEKQQKEAWQSTKVVDPTNENRFVYVPTPEAMQRYGLSQEAAEVYSAVRGDFQEFLDEMHKVGMYEIADLRLGRAPALAIHEAITRKVSIGELDLLFDAFVDQTADVQLRQEVRAARQELKEQYAALSKKPYTPFARFGQWGVLVKRPADRKTVYFATFESEKEQQAHALEISRDPKFANLGVTTTYIEDLPYSLAGLPPAIAASLKHRLNLTQQQSKELDDILSGYMSANSFVRRLTKRHGVEGYSEDVMRGYADYFRRGATYITNTKSKMEMADALGLLKRYITEIQNQPGFHDTRTLERLHEWLEKSFDYAMHPDAEPGALKSFVSLFHFGFNISSAAVNMLQVPMATLPYLAQRHGWVKAVSALKQAYKDVVGFKNWAELPEEEQAMINYGLSQGSFDESLAMTVAQMADGYYLSRSNVVTATRRVLNKTNHVALWMFRTAEELNRRVTALATYRLERKAELVQQQATGNFDMEAYRLALDAVQDTQGEYAVENRPMFMRGNLSAVFQFMQFSQNMTFQLFGGDKSWKKLMLVQVAIAGILGMPFASDAAELIKLIGRSWFGKDWNVDYEVRKYLQDSAVSPDLILRGLSSDVFGFDLSQRVSLGDLIPGMKAVASHRKLRDVMYDATGDIGGPGISLMLNAFRFIGEDDPRLLHRFQAIAPSALRNVLRGIESEVAEGVRDRDGALLYDPNAFALAGYTVGFLPKELSDKYNARSAVNEAATFWTHRRQVLMEEMRYIIMQKQGDREALSDVLEAIAKFNRDAPDPKLIINRKALITSLKAEVKSVASREAGFGTNPQAKVLASQINQAF